MSEFLAMGGRGAYVWAAYGITLAILLWNVWSAAALHRRNLRQASREANAEEPGRRPKVSQIESE
jgi:heme exporter protein D